MHKWLLILLLFIPNAYSEIGEISELRGNGEVLRADQTDRLLARASLDIRATEVRFLDSRNSGPSNSTNETFPRQSQSQESGQGPQVSAQAGEEFDDLPW